MNRQPGLPLPRMWLSLVSRPSEVPLDLPAKHFPPLEEHSKYLMGMIVVSYNDAGCILLKCYTQLQLAGEVRENFTMLYTYTTKPRIISK